jgi:hypothetical protein
MDINNFFQAAAQLSPQQMTVSLLAKISEQLDTLISLQHGPQPGSMQDMLRVAQQHGAQVRVVDTAEPARNPDDLSRTPIIQASENNVMRDSHGEPEIIRFPLPYGHGTIIYRRWLGNPQQWGFNLSVQGPDGIPKQYERVEDNV